MANSTQALKSLNETIGSFRSRVDVKVDNVAQTTASIQATADKIYENIERFHTDMIKGEEKQIAHENIIRIDQVIKEQFSTHETVRRTVMGIVKDFDINLVRNSTIKDLSEELWITSSRYWLSYALIAVTAWVNDFPEVANNALAECQRRDDVKATLLFCLMNMRFARMETAKRWFAEYMRTVDPENLHKETAILLQSFLDGVFGNDKQLEHEVNTIIAGWIGVMNANEEAANELIGAYYEFIRNITVSEPFDYPWLQLHCENLSQLETAFNGVSKYAVLLNFLQALDVEQQRQSEANYKSRIDAILTELISNYDEDEQHLKRQKGYYECVMEKGGNLEQAEEQFAALQKLQEGDINIGRQMLRWVIHDDDSQTNPRVRKFGFQNTRDWFVTAVERWTILLKEAFPHEYCLRIDTWQGISNGSDQAEQMQSLVGHYEVNKFQNKFVNTPNIAALLVLVASAGLAFVMLYSLVATGLSLGFLVWRVIKANKEYPRRIAAAQTALSSCMAELGVFRAHYKENLAQKETLIGYAQQL